MSCGVCIHYVFSPIFLSCLIYNLLTGCCSSRVLRKEIV
nr:MAG TPA: hypothetical protein [Caudoviricetes sp.]